MHPKPLPDYLFVSTQVLLFVGLYLISDNFLQPYLGGIPNWLFLSLEILGFILSMTAVLQLNFRISVFPSPTKDTKLITNLAYRYLRHPIYSGLILFFASFSIASGSVFRLILTLALFFLFNQKAKYEETLLTKNFPDYKDYVAKTWRIIPFVGRVKSIERVER